jgi:Oxygenase domain of the 2OGFeDO superfamily
VRSRISPEELELKKGKVIGDDAYNVLLTGPTTVYGPTGKPLCVYLPGAMRGVVTEPMYEVLHSLRSLRTDTRARASGSRTFKDLDQVRSLAISSAIIGSVDSSRRFRYCRTTAWTGRHMPEWELLRPAFQRVAELMVRHVPDRYAAQMSEIDKTHPDWVIPGTPFTTITVNNTYPTGVHTDKGDLDKGFSSIFVVRRGEYTGGRFVFPEYRVAVDMADDDLILMDAHQWHGNTAMHCTCGKRLIAWCADCKAERISVVSYMRTEMTACGSEAEEIQKAVAYREKTKGVDR